MAPHLPPFAALRAFEAAARHINFSRAAEELHLTHGAISHQMKALEAGLGVQLFRREGRRMLLTDAGQLFASRVRDALDELSAAVAAVAAPREQHVLTLSVLPSFASLWLIPRLASFHARHPEIDINIRASLALAEFGRDGIDVAIRIGRGGWPDVTAEKLFDEEVFPVASPRLKGLPLKPSELGRFTLLRSERQPWAPWFKAMGLDLAEPVRGPAYSDETLLLQAAAQGIGIALARGAMAAADLAAGRLIRLFPDRVPPKSAYYLVYPRANAGLARVKAFRDWILEKARVQPSRRGIEG
ncbi:MAG TPA: transcriptional regulator GcvA [Stellaceae bacterium]|nr:transcriptional regulator GcvA [Stellaceae bacterium]